MKTSTEIQHVARKVGLEKAIEYVAKAGFDAWDFSMCDMSRFIETTGEISYRIPELMGNDYLKYARRLKQVGLDNGIVCNQSHAPFPASNPEIRSYFKRAIECTAEAGGNICVIHPDNNKSPQENADMYFEILDFAKKCGVKIATENMWNWDTKKDCAIFAACATPENFKAHIDAVNDDFFVACVDIGHAEMMGPDVSAVNMIKMLGSKVQALHIHDNDKLHDSHQIPFSMDIDFVPIVKALQEINYSGFFTLETMYMADYEIDNIPTGLKNLSQSVRRLADMFDGKIK